MATVVTNAGKEWHVDKVDESVSTKANKIGWGTGAGTAGVGDTALFTEASEARVTGAESQPAATTYRVVGTLIANGTKNITNAGTFDATSAGVLNIHGDHASVPMVLNDGVEYTFDEQVT